MISLLLILAVVTHLSQQKELFISYSTQKQSSEIFKYFHNTTHEFYVDIGAYDPIYASNTIHLQGWKGINVQASTKRHKNFMVSRLNQINLNVAITNQSGGYVKLVQYAEDSAASIDSQYLAQNKNAALKPIEQDVQKMTLADLCHLYYIKRPKLMNIDVEGHGFTVLNSNDWSAQICLPELIIIQKEKNEEKNAKHKHLLQQNKYSLEKSTTLNEFYIHSSILSMYRKVEQAGVKLLQNMRVQYWAPLYQSIFKVISPSYPQQFQNFKHINPVTSPIFIHFANEKVISIEKIRRYSKFISKESNQSLLLMHYNPLKSKMYFGSTQYKIKKVPTQKEVLYHIEIQYPSDVVNLYVLDHGLFTQQQQILNILDKSKDKVIPKQCQKPKIVTREKQVFVDDYLG